ncbi:MAG: polysaccharide biosynthesis/export family protein [Myxococcota bacterium]
MNDVKKVSRLIGMWTLLGVAVFALGCVGAGAPIPPEETAGDRKDFVIGISDQLRILVWKNPELTVLVPVRRDGKISVPLVDDIQAEGLTPEELKQVLTEALSEFVTAPDVTVIVETINSQIITVIGGVVRSGQVRLVRQMRVVEAIASMGGFNGWAKTDRIKIMRPVGDEMVEYLFDYGAFSAGKAPGSNLVLKPGDTIVVPD